MGERALKWGLRVLGIGLFVGPILAALAIYGASIDLVMPSPNPLEALGNVEGLFGENSIEIVDNQITLTNFEITIRFTNPLDYALEFNDFSANITCALETPHADLGTISLKEPVTAQPHSSVDLTLTAGWAQAAAHYLSEHLGVTEASVNLENLSFKLYEMTIQTNTAWTGLTIPLS